MNRRRMQVIYSGRVQGVGFRYQSRQVATGFEITGIVRNLPDGSVELVAEGTEAELKSFREAIRECGLGPMIREEREIWSEPRGEFRGFEIVR
ncbi:MAG: acylphosphatase [Verrucomicrobia bacterium]|nr:MAG: acylphosphatase [Verrucomicrobiota bacterium]